MSMTSVNRAFAAALGTKGTSQGCTMTWERGEDGKQRQRLSCKVTLPSGEERIFTELFEGGADLAKSAESLARDVAETIQSEG